MFGKYSKYAFIGTAFVLVFLAFFLMTNNSQKKEKFNFDNVELIQLQPPKEGQDIATIKTSMGDFSIMLFTEEAPNAVAHFKEVVNSGYYTDTYIFGIQTDVFFMAGSKNEDGTATEEFADIANKTIPLELSPNLWPIKGSIASYGPPKKSWIPFMPVEYFGGTYILGVNSIEFDEDITTQLKEMTDANQDIINALIDNGGVPNFAQQHTIFAQTYEGMDVYEKITGVVTDSETIRPTEPVLIKEIILGQYKSEDNLSTIDENADSSSLDQ